MISERLFEIMEQKGISGYRLSKMTGISRQTIHDWKKKKTNPGADKIMIICDALDIMPEDLLREENVMPDIYIDGDEETWLISGYQQLSEEKKKRLLMYMNRLRVQERGSQEEHL